MFLFIVLLVFTSVFFSVFFLFLSSVIYSPTEMFLTPLDLISVIFSYSLDVEIFVLVLLALVLFGHSRKDETDEIKGMFYYQMRFLSLLGIAGVFFIETVCAVMKHFIVSERPDADFCAIVLNAAKDRNHGMPSSHSALAAFLFIFFYFVLSRFFRFLKTYGEDFDTRRIKFTKLVFILSVVLCALLNVGIALSRYQLGCHTLEQIAVGSGIGLAGGLVWLPAVFNVFYFHFPRFVSFLDWFASLFVQNNADSLRRFLFLDVIAVSISGAVCAHDPFEYFLFLLHAPLIPLVVLLLDTVLLVVMDIIRNRNNTHVSLFFSSFLAGYTIFYIFFPVPSLFLVFFALWVLLCTVFVFWSSIFSRKSTSEQKPSYLKQSNNDATSTNKNLQGGKAGRNKGKKKWGLHQKNE